MLVLANSKGILNGFEIAGSDNVFYPASAKIINKRLESILKSKDAKE